MIIFVLRSHSEGYVRTSRNQVSSTYAAYVCVWFQYPLSTDGCQYSQNIWFYCQTERFVQ